MLSAAHDVINLGFGVASDACVRLSFLRSPGVEGRESVILHDCHKLVCRASLGMMELPTCGGKAVRLVFRSPPMMRVFPLCGWPARFAGGGLWSSRQSLIHAKHVEKCLGC